MSFGKSNKQTWLLVALIPTALFIGYVIGWAVNYGGNSGFGSATLEIKGSTTVEPICLATATRFEATHPGIEISISAAGSGTGIAAVIDGQADVGMSSRAVKASENATALLETNQSLRQFAIAKDGLAVITHLNAIVNFDMNISLIKMIFNGTITSWDHVELTGNGLTGEIQVIARESTSGTRSSFDDLIMEDDDYVNDFQEKVSNQEVHDEINSNPQAIGYIGLAYMTEYVESVFIDGIEATEENIISGSYALSRSLYLVTLGTPVEDSLVWEYVQWHYSPTAQTEINEVGYIAIQKKEDEI